MLSRTVRRGLLRHYSTQSPSRRNISGRTYIYAAGFTLFGLISGHLVRHAYVPPAAPEPGTSEDTLVVKQKEWDIDRLPMVRKLREGAEWKELKANGSLAKTSGEQKQSQNTTSDGVGIGFQTQNSKTLIQKAMAGIRGVGIRRTFWNHGKGELVMLVWIGQGIGGWPGVAHGGALATVLEEGLREVALGIDTDWTTLPEQPNTLNLSYIKPTFTNSFYVIRVTKSAAQVTEQDGINPKIPKDHSPLSKEVNATLESLEGKVLVKARGTFTIPAVAQAKVEAQNRGIFTWQGLKNNIVPKWLT